MPDFQEATLQGRFITIEGGEGVGKSTFARAVAQCLRDRNIASLETREPGGTEVAQRIRALFLDPPAAESTTKRSELYLVSAARAQHVDHRLKPALASGQWVVCDRFHDSARVYQGVLGGIDGQILETIIAHSVNGLEPDLTFLLDCDEQVALNRLGARAGETAADHHGNRFDQAGLSHHHTIREAFLVLARRYKQRIVVIDAASSTAAMVAAALSVLEHRFAPLAGRATEQ